MGKVVLNNLSIWVPIVNRDKAPNEPPKITNKIFKNMFRKSTYYLVEEYIRIINHV